MSRPVIHVEAGVRSHSLNEPWPEEHIRTSIDAISALLLAATTAAQDNLLLEGFSKSIIKVTGNSVVSAINRYAKPIPVKRLDPRLLVTLHRRELRMHGKAQAVANRILDLAAEQPILWPVHPAMRGYVPYADNDVVEPLPYVDMIEVLSASKGLLTDSGGLVEEATTLGVPTAILRNVNDRPEAVEAGIARVFPPTPQGVDNAFTWLQTAERLGPSTVFGDVDSADKIADEIIKATS
jgi:UDP-N-acetylglucosamine 2-epimerase (non-hydrolysing)